MIRSRPPSTTPKRSVAIVLALLWLCLAMAGPSSLAPAMASSATLRAGDRAIVQEGAERAADHVVLISIDGLRPEFYLDRTWPAPTLQQMAADGAHAQAVRTVFPSVTYPSHTTILTGALPDRHGVHYNSPFEPEEPTGRWYWEEELIRVPTLWDAVREAGGTVVNLSWPVSVGAPVDVNLPEIWPLDRDADPVETVRDASRPAGVLDEVEREATGRLTAEDFTIDHLARDDHAGAAAAYLFATRKPTLMTLHLIEVDHFSHEEGRQGPTMRRAVAVADRAVGRIVEAAENAGVLDRTAFVVTGDHGFVDVHTRLSPNVWLAEAGVRSPARDRGDWKATFHTTGASAFLHLRDPDNRETLERVREILDDLPRSTRRLFRIIDREELDRLGAAPDAALALAPVPGIAIGSSAEAPALGPASGGTHGYLPHVPLIKTGFVGWGAGFRPGAVAPEIRLQDIAPIIATLLDLPFEAPDGMSPAGLLESDAR